MSRQSHGLFPTNFIRDNDDWRQRCIAVVCPCANFTLFRFSFLLKIKESMEVITKFKLWITSTTSTVPKSNPTSFSSRPLSPVKILFLIYLSVKAQLSGKILYFFLKYSQSMFSVSWIFLVSMSIIIIFLF